MIWIAAVALIWMGVLSLFGFCCILYGARCLDLPLTHGDEL